MEYVKEITLDFSGEMHFEYIATVQGDSARKIKINLISNSQSYIIPADAIATFRCIKPDGKNVINEASINEDGTVMVSLTEQILSTVGNCECKVSLYDVNGSSLTTVPFIIKVIKGAINPNITSENEYTALVSALAKVETVNNEAESSSIEAKKSAEVAQTSASEAKQAANKFIIDSEMSNTSLNAVQNKVIKKYVDGERETVIVNTPIFTIQPTIEGALNSAFKAWNEDYYYVHLLGENTFTLMPNRGDVANAINQVFTLSGLNTGNSGILKENDPVDFLTIGNSFSMRKAGVSEVIFNNLNCNEIEFIGGGYCNNSGYIMPTTYINSLDSRFTDVHFFSNVGKYSAGSGFICGTSDINGKNILNSFKFDLNLRNKIVDCNYTITNIKCSDTDKYTIISKQNMSFSGIGFDKNGLDLPETFKYLKFAITNPYIFRNGFELTAIKRSV